MNGNKFISKKQKGMERVVLPELQFLEALNNNFFLLK